MKSTHTKHQVDPIIKYPCLMTNGNFIVLFTQAGIGTVITILFEHDTSIEIGYHCDQWTLSNFVLYNGTITLSND